TRDNNKYRLAGYQAINDTAIKELHYLTVSDRRLFNCVWSPLRKRRSNKPFFKWVNLPTSTQTNLRWKRQIKIRIPIFRKKQVFC
ncbi:hypothetical protein, partial [Spiroplasma sp. ChiS]|uniref:hypothetical protein n=1 Tax=Spiroplasma sp. ChiS TaxID=2099885 RepID=UPI001F1CE8A5